MRVRDLSVHLRGWEVVAVYGSLVIMALHNIVWMIAKAMGAV